MIAVFETTQFMDGPKLYDLENKKQTTNLNVCNNKKNIRYISNCSFVI